VRPRPFDQDIGIVGGMGAAGLATFRLCVLIVLLEIRHCFLAGRNGPLGRLHPLDALDAQEHQCADDKEQEAKTMRYAPPPDVHGDDSLASAISPNVSEKTSSTTAPTNMPTPRGVLDRRAQFEFRQLDLAVQHG